MLIVCYTALIMKRYCAYQLSAMVVRTNGGSAVFGGITTGGSIINGRIGSI